MSNDCITLEKALDSLSTDQLKEFCVFLDMLLEKQNQDQSGNRNTNTTE